MVNPYKPPPLTMGSIINKHKFLCSSGSSRPSGRSMAQVMQLIQAISWQARGSGGKERFMGKFIQIFRDISWNLKGSIRTSMEIIGIDRGTCVEI